MKHPITIEVKPEHLYEYLQPLYEQKQNITKFGLAHLQPLAVLIFIDFVFFIFITQHLISSASWICFL